MWRNLREAQASRRLYEAAQADGTPNRFFAELATALQEGQLDRSRFSIRNTFRQFVEDGNEMIESFSPRNQADGMRLLEAGGAVDTTAFSNITGQFVYSTVLEQFQSPTFIAGDLARTVPTEFNGEKIPGVGGLGDATKPIGEGEDYPTAGVGEEWIETPETDKHGVIVPVTKEAIFFDRTSLVLDRAGKVAEALAIRKEKRVLDVALGITTSYVRNGATAQATYGNTHTEGDFDNLVASNALVDYTDVETALLAFDSITDPNTGEPVLISVADVVVPSGLLFTAARVFEATGIEQGTISASAPRTIGGNPLVSPAVKRGNSFSITTNQYVANRTGNQTTWFIGDFKAAFQYRENWPVSVVQAPENSHDDFHRDIVSQFKVSERGTPAVIEPRKVVKCTA